MEFEYAWAMPNKNTFEIGPIKKLISEEFHGKKVNSIDPFARNSNFAKFTNDLNENTSSQCHIDALVYLKRIRSNFIDEAYYDPIYTPRQMKECYEELNVPLTFENTSSKSWTLWKKELARIIKPGGKILSCGYTGYGLGKNLGFETTHVLVVVHGGVHNATICTIEVKK